LARDYLAWRRSPDSKRSRRKWSYYYHPVHQH
jgi:hypothetical protein